MRDAVDSDLGLEAAPDRSHHTLPAFLREVASRHGDRTALRFGDETLGFRDLERRARSVAKGLVASGVGKGTRVGVLMANRPEWAVAAFGAALAGGVVVPVNTYATDEERDYILRHSDTAVLLMQRGLLQHDFPRALARRHPALGEGEPGRVRCPALPFLRAAFALGIEEPVGAVAPWAALEAAGEGVGDDLLDQIAAEVTPADDGIVIYTSGTTAHPKGVLHYQRAPVIQSWRFAQDLGLTPEDVVWTAQPFFWTAGVCMSLGASLAAGATLLLQEVFEPGAAIAAIARHRATIVHAWPHQEKAIAEHPDASPETLGSARKVNFQSPLAPVVGLEKDEWGTSGTYGLSETFTLASAIPAAAPAERREATSGLPLPGMQLRIVDPESGSPLPPGEKGEIAVRGVTFMRGYYKVEPELYLDGDGFFHTQDGGHLDTEGYLHWSGRLGNLVKTGGANVSPVEIERALDQLPGLRAGLAVGVPHPVLGELLVLCAVPIPGAELDAETIRAHLRERLSAYKVPRVVLFFGEDELQFTGNQKIQLGPLREAARARLERDGVEVAGHRYALRESE